MDPQREWWHRTLAVAARPRSVFAALREGSQDDLEARQEPVLAIVLLAGIGGILATPAWNGIMDNPERDGLVVAVLTFVGGGLYGTAAYFIAGGALALALRGLGAVSTFRRARHTLAFAVAPLALLIVVALVELAVYGEDALSSGGDDDGTGAVAFVVLQLAIVAWALCLLAYGIRVVEGFSWPRALASLGLVALFVSAFSVLANGLL